MTAPATRQTGRGGLVTAAATVFVVGGGGGEAEVPVGDRALTTRRRETRNPARAVTNAITSRLGGGGGGATRGGGGSVMAPADELTMARVAEMKAKKDNDVEELYLADAELESTPTILGK